MRIVLTAGLLWLVGGPLGAQVVDLAEASLDSLLAVQVSAAARYDQTAAQAPASVTVITAEDIERFGWRTLAEVLASVRGFYVSDDRNYTYVGVRGIGRPTDYNNRVLLLLDGHPLNEGYYGGAPGGTDLGVDLATVDRIEVVRGAGSALYGSNAMFAVVQIITREAPSDVGAAVRASMGEWQSRSAEGEVWGSIGPVAAMVSGGWLSSQGEEVSFPEFGRSAPGMDADDLTHAAARLRWGNMRVQGRTWERWKHFPTAAWGSDFNDPDARSRDMYQFMEASWWGQLGPHRRVQFRGALDRYTYDGFYPGEGVVHSDANTVLRGLVAGEMVWDLRADNRLVLGGDWRRHPRAEYLMYEDGELTWEGDFPFDTWSVFVQDEHQVTPDLVLLAGGRFDRNTMGFQRVTPRGAVVWTPTASNVFKALYGEAFRAPTAHELYYEDIAFLPSGGLEPEVVRTAELVWERRLARAAWATVSLFDSEVRQLIDTVDVDEDFAMFENRERMKTRGAELELQARADQGLAKASWAYVSAEVVGEGEATNVPEHVVRGSVAGRIAGPLSFAVEGRHETGRLTLQGSRTSAATLIDVRFRAAGMVPGLGVWVGVRNLLDAAFSVPGGFEHVQASIPQAGRFLHAGLEYRF